MSQRLPTIDKFRLRGPWYCAFDIFQVEQEKNWVELTVPKRGWAKGLKWSVISSFVFALFFSPALLPSSQPGGYFAFLALVAICIPTCCLWPLYISALKTVWRRSKPPLLSIDRNARAVWVDGGKQSCHLSNVVAFCVISKRAEGDDSDSSELQMLIRRNGQFEFIFVASSLKLGNELLGPIADDLHRAVGVRHLSVDLDRQVIRG